MSVGGALTAMSLWLNHIYKKCSRGDDLPHLSIVVIARGILEKSLATRGLPIAKAVYSFLKDNISPTFNFTVWYKGRIVCQRPQLKSLQTLASDMSADVHTKELLSITDSTFPHPGARIYTREDHHIESKSRVARTEKELMAAAMG